jgi:predicted transcriptional regulator
MARPKGTPKTNRVTVSLDDQTHRVLQAYSDRDDVSISWLIRRAVAEMIDQREKAGPKHEREQTG